MKLRIHVLVIVVITFAALAIVHPALAIHEYFVTGVTCNLDSNTITVTGNYFGNGTKTSTIGADIIVNGQFLKEREAVGPNNPNFPNATIASFSDSDSAYILGANIFVTDMVTGTSASTTCSRNAVTWCNLSGDGRINSLCGDRIVVYCNANQTPPNIDLWVVDTSSVGHELAKINLSDLTSVPAGKFVKNLGANGVIFAGSDTNGNSYAALQGGPYGGTTTGDWLKTFRCKA